MTTPPELCATCAALIGSSSLHWVECGGMSVGMERTPKSWQLRPDSEVADVKRMTKVLQQLAGAHRRLEQAAKTFNAIGYPDCAGDIRRFLERNSR